MNYIAITNISVFNIYFSPVIIVEQLLNYYYTYFKIYVNKLMLVPHKFYN